jgi:hypothetical protein
LQLTKFWIRRLRYLLSFSGFASKKRKLWKHIIGLQQDIQKFSGERLPKLCWYILLCQQGSGYDHILSHNTDPVLRIRLFLGPLDLDPLVHGPDLAPGPSIIKQKIVRKTLIPIVLLLLYDFLNLWIMIKMYRVPSKSNEQKNLENICFFVGLMNLKVNAENSRIRRRSRIRSRIRIH